MTPPPTGRTRPRVLSYRARLFFMFYLIAEAAALFGVGMLIGVGYTVLLMAATSVLGAILMRAIGMKAAREYREAISRSRPPGPSAVSGTIGVVGGFLLFLPGFVTDLVGLLCVFPPTRFLLRPLVTGFLAKRVDSPSYARWFGPRVVTPQWGSPRPDGARDPDAVIDGDVVEGEIVDDDPGTAENGPKPPP